MRRTREMKTPEPRHPIKYADRLDYGVVIVFSDGKQGFFSADMLYAMLPQAETLPPSETEANASDE